MYFEFLVWLMACLQMEGIRSMTYTAASHQSAIETFGFTFGELLCRPSSSYSHYLHPCHVDILMVVLIALKLRM